MVSAHQLENASNAWVKAGAELGFELTAPFAIELDGESVICVAFLPHFGGPNGMIVAVLDPQSSIDQRIIQYSRKNGLFYSFVGLNYGNYERSRFVEALEDWGYYGPQDKCPVWFKGYKGGRSLP
jgi:hypothetical protein